MKKKILSLAIVLLLITILFTLVGCGDNKDVITTEQEANKSSEVVKEDKYDDDDEKEDKKDKEDKEDDEEDEDDDGIIKEGTTISVGGYTISCGWYKSNQGQHGFRLKDDGTIFARNVYYKYKIEGEYIVISDNFKLKAEKDDTLSENGLIYNFVGVVYQ